MRCPGTWELFQLYTGYLLVIKHILKGTPTPHTRLLVSRHTKVQVWGKLVIKSLQVLFKEYPSLHKNQLWLTYKKRKRERVKKREKRREKSIEKMKRKRKEKKENSERGRE